MMLRAKVDGALRIIDTGLAGFKKPAVMCSFGKDSLVVLHLVRSIMPEIPVIFHREPFQPQKYAFANKVIQDWNLAVYDYAPSGVAVHQSETEFEIARQYTIGRESIMVPVGIRPPVDGQHVLCGLRDLYQRPLGGFNYPWDLVFHGHKSSDVDPILGAVPITCDFARNVNSVSAAFPIRHFTDQDVWEYIESNDIPIHTGRYEKIDGEWREREDKTDNPDYINACVACMKKDGGPVECPKLNGSVIANVWPQLVKVALPNLTYLKET